MTDMDSDLGNHANGSQGDEHNSAVNTETEMPSWAVKLNQKVDEALSQARAAQSGKDKGIANLQKQLDQTQGEFAKVAEYLKKYPDPADAERFYMMDRFLQSQEGNIQGNNAFAQQNADPASQSSAAGIVNPELLKQYGVDPQSPEYLQQVSQGKTGFEAVAAVLASRQVSGNREGVATGASGGAGGSTASQATQQQVLRDQYEAELDAAQKNGGGVLRPGILYNIQQKYSKLGLQNVG